MRKKEELKEKNKWVIVAACTVLLALSLGMYANTNSIFVKPVCEDLRLQRGEYTLYRTILLLLSAVTMPLYGRVIHRFSIRRVFLVGVLIVSGAIYGYSICTSLWQIYLFSFIHGLAYNSVGFLTVGILIRQYFRENQGLACGIAYAGSGLGAAIFVPILNPVIAVFGWRFAYRGMAVLGLLVMIPVILLCIPPRRDNPSDRVSNPGRRFQKGGHLWRRADVWMIYGCCLIFGITTSACNSHVAPYFADIGYSGSTVSLVVSLMMVFTMCSKIGVGFIYDHFGIHTGNLIISITGIGSFALFLAAELPVMAWSSVILDGVYQCSMSIPVTVLAGSYFHGSDFSQVFSVGSMICALGAAASVSATGYIYDMTGSYRPAWGIYLVLCIVTAVLLFGVERVNKDGRKRPYYHLEKKES